MFVSVFGFFNFVTEDWEEADMALVQSGMGNV
jgi:hypothetical protein